MTDIIDHVRAVLAEGPITGPFCKTCDPALIEALGQAGFAFGILDLEHGGNDLPTLGHLLRAAHCGGLLPVVRVPDADPSLIGRVLDLGAGGVQVPDVRNAATARACVQAARFAPLGSRGVCRFVRAADYGGMERSAYFSAANQALLVLQVEGAEGIAALDEILAVDGFDVLFIGPYDLSQSLGHPGEIEHPAVIAAIEGVVTRCAAAGVACGIFCDNAVQAARWRGLGVRYLATSVDVAIFADAARGLAHSLLAAQDHHLSESA
jgi:4-hydroxy-2-oxoheptanedioate aldolase